MWDGVEMGGAGSRELWDANAPAWTALSRAGYDHYRDLVNTPAFFEMLPAVSDSFGLDVGCGEGHNTRLLAATGADLVGVDLSQVFLEAAASATPEVRFIHADAAELPVPDATFDFVTAFMSLMDTASPEACLSEAKRVLKPGGFIQFSILHPATATPIRSWVRDEERKHVALTIGDYFYEGPVTEQWTFGTAPVEERQHFDDFTITYARRTLATWINAVIAAGLQIEAMCEPTAHDDIAREHPEVADTQIVPYFLIIRARNAAAPDIVASR